MNSRPPVQEALDLRRLLGRAVEQVHRASPSQ
jgi:hypothetical protein